MYDMEIINLKLNQIHNDILALHLCMIVDNMYEAGMVSKDEYITMLNQAYETVSEHIIKSCKKE